ncbi:MAG: glycosyltransferase family 2 protein [Pirellulales bacterium]|nr:glycosyltransferase family 2 protein [Pirellulales bacterium]
MPKLTVLIPCKDEAHNIRACVDSVRPIADEILIADSGSTDGTLDIVRKLEGCRVIEREYINSANFKNWAIPQATHPWVLIVDADERPSFKLIRQIRRVMGTTPAYDGYHIRFATYFLGHRLWYSGTQTVTSVRLFRKAVGRYSDMRVHADVLIRTGKVSRMHGRMHHYTCQCLNRFVQTFNRYTTWSALDMYDQGRRVSFLGLVLRPPARFLQFYILRRGFLDRTSGLIYCLLMAYYTFLKYAKLWELQHSLTKHAMHRESSHDNRTTDVENHQTMAA